jgi:sulfite reductase alpha subunit-like flavoprotein
MAGDNKVTTDDNTPPSSLDSAFDPAPPTPDYLLSIETLYEQENDPELRLVLRDYRSAEISLQSAIDRLRGIARPRWALACSSRSRELCIQVNRYVQAERKRDGRPQARPLPPAPEGGT